MDLHTIRAIERPDAAEDVRHWRQGMAWLAGGTWLFSEPQPDLDTLVDLEGLRWPSLTAGPDGLTIAATARIRELELFACPADWSAAPLLPLCCQALLMSFKVAHEATVGGNICMSLPAGAMISLTVALAASYRLEGRDGDERTVRALDFVTGNHANVLRPGELLRAIHVPVESLQRRVAFRRASLVRQGRSAVLLVGTAGAGGDLLLTITASTPRPLQVSFPAPPSADEVRAAVEAAVRADGFFDDVNGAPAYRRHLTFHFAEEIRAELAGPGGVA